MDEKVKTVAPLTLPIEMKKLLPLLLFLASCHEENVVPVPPELEPVKLSNITLAEAKATSALTKMGNLDILEHGFVYAENNETPKLGEAAEVLKGPLDPATPSPLNLQADLKGLKTNTVYFIRSFAQVHSGVHYGESTTFRTLNMIPPGVRTEPAENINIDGARIKGTLTAKGTHPIAEYGLAWSISPAPSTALNTKISFKENVSTFPKTFFSDVKDLKANTAYYVRAYVISNGLTTYGAELSFTTPAIAQPVIRTDGAAEITLSSAKLSGTVVRAGSLAITERGIVWGTSSQPTTAGNKASLAGNLTSFPTSYTLLAKGLQKNTQYHYRAYVISGGVTTYGENKNFVTPEATPPGVRTEEATQLQPEAARLGGTLTAGGSYPINERGIVYGLSQASATTKLSLSGNITAFPHSYHFDLKGLNKSTTYHYRAYVISNATTFYGEFKTFTTPNVSPPGIRTDAPANLSPTSARLGGTVLHAGTYPLSERGVVYGMLPNPTTSGNKSAISGNVSTYPSPFGIDIHGLSKNTTYYFRAYVIANGVTSYGENLSFRTPDLVPPGIRTDDATNIHASGARLSGTVTSAGSFPISERGIVYHTTSNPTTGNGKSALSGNLSAFPSSFGMDIAGLSPKTTYHYRAFVTSNGSTLYGENKTFTTSAVSQPEVRTDGADQVQVNSAKLLGTVTKAGSFPISEYGLVYSTSASPTTSSAKAVAGAGINSYPHSFSVQVSGLNKSTMYYFRAYAISNGVTSYGAVNTITTPDDRPVKIATEQATNVGLNAAQLGGFIADGGSSPVQEIGVCWSTSANPTTSDAKASKSGSGVGFPHSYSFEAQGLKEGTAYHFRAYAISNGVTFYGGDVSFKTSVAQNPSVSTGDYRHLNASAVSVQGSIRDPGTYPITEYGIVYGLNLDNAKKVGQKASSSLRYPFGYTFEIEGLGGITVNTYYYRAYAITTTGSIHYGEIRSFRK